MPNTRSGATMTREGINKLTSCQVAKALEARDAATKLKPLMEGGDDQEEEYGDDYDGGNGNGIGNGVGNINGGVNGNGYGGGNKNGNGNGNGNGNDDGNGGGNGQGNHSVNFGEVYCLRNEIKKMETELWNLTVKGNDLTAYTRRFQELVLLCTRMVPDEEDKVERFIRGLPDNIQGNVIVAEPTRLKDAIHIANNLMDQKLKGYARSAENKRRFDNNPRDNRGQQPAFKRQNVRGHNVARAYTAGNNEKKGYVRSLPYYNKCKLHYEGPCTVRGGNCKRVGHMVGFWFFWGFKDDEKRLIWIKWKMALASIDQGGLGIGSIYAKNTSLLGKWWWHFLYDREALCCRVIKSIYGNEGGLMGELGTGLKYRVWENILSVGAVIDDMGIPFRKSFIKKIRCGNSISFWADKARDCTTVVATNTQRPPVGNQPGNEATERDYAIGGGGANLDSNVVTSTFLLNNCASMLFDSGANKSFVSSTFSALLDVAPFTLDTSHAVELVDERISETNVVLRGCTLGLLGHPFDIDLMPVELGSFNVIIGTDWLAKYHEVIICDEKVVRIPYGDEVLIIQGNDCDNGSKLNMSIISCTKTQKYMHKGCQVYLAQVTSKKTEDMSEEKRLKDVPIVREFLEVFPEDLPRLLITPKLYIFSMALFVYILSFLVNFRYLKA
ncbi:putative reverse transcriptase domain-containing protein [Tanacetum coccineum]